MGQEGYPVREGDGQGLTLDAGEGRGRNSGCQGGVVGAWGAKLRGRGWGPWSRVNEVHAHDGKEEVSVILDRVQWDIIEVGDPEYPLDSPEVSEDEGEGDFEAGVIEEEWEMNPLDSGSLDGLNMHMSGPGAGGSDAPGTEEGGHGEGGHEVGVEGDDFPLSPGTLSMDFAPKERATSGPQGGGLCDFLGAVQLGHSSPDVEPHGEQEGGGGDVPTIRPSHT